MEFGGPIKSGQEKPTISPPRLFAPIGRVCFLVFLARLRQCFEPTAQHSAAVPIEERAQQAGHLLDVLVGQRLAPKNVDDALRRAPLGDVTLAPARLRLAVLLPLIDDIVMRRDNLQSRHGSPSITS